MSFKGKLRYAAVIEKVRHGYSAYVPDLPGCIAAARTRTRVEKLISEAIKMHVEAMRERGEAIPTPSEIKFVAVHAA